MRRSPSRAKAAKPARRSTKAAFRKILCPIDFDRISIPALTLAQTMAVQNSAMVYLLYVVPASLRSQLGQMAHDNLRAVTRKWLEGKVRNEIVVRFGKPVESVLRAADELGADLIVMATHGRTGVSRARLGSVTEEVVRRSTRPVMTVRPS